MPSLPSQNFLLFSLFPFLSLHPSTSLIPERHTSCSYLRYISGEGSHQRGFHLEATRNNAGDDVIVERLTTDDSTPPSPPTTTPPSTSASGPPSHPTTPTSPALPEFLTSHLVTLYVLPLSLSTPLSPRHPNGRSVIPEFYDTLRHLSRLAHSSRHTHHYLFFLQLVSPGYCFTL
ncbi:hypothetical protein E2C01_099245 [Portunus trituberculatus]|uniref:Uncharacterized protein n=1 Tax=Portunus trituberculatus TaxID=210409 RepID=A0A5B7K500_PORTR|nr:hypothetical protein [Portunus trituberculatus]